MQPRPVRGCCFSMRAQPLRGIELTRMAEEGNLHFRQLAGGAPGEVLAALGEGLLALSRQRAGQPVDSAPALRQAVLELTRWLVRQRPAQLNPEQRLFLASG